MAIGLEKNEGGCWWLTGYAEVSELQSRAEEGPEIFHTSVLPAETSDRWRKDYNIKGPEEKGRKRAPPCKVPIRRSREIPEVKVTKPEEG